MTTERNFKSMEEVKAQLDELQITVAAMLRRQDEQLAKMREDAKKRDRLGDEDVNGDGG